MKKDVYKFKGFEVPESISVRTSRNQKNFHHRERRESRNQALYRRHQKLLLTTYCLLAYFPWALRSRLETPTFGCGFKKRTVWVNITNGKNNPAQEKPLP